MSQVRGYRKLELKDSVNTKQFISNYFGRFIEDGSEILHTNDELLAYYELALGIHDDRELSGYILHLGCWQGGSLCLMGEAVKASNVRRKLVIGVDPYPSWYKRSLMRHNYMVVREKIIDFDLEQQVCLVHHQDVPFFEVASIPARLIFIDTFHDANYLRQEIRVVLPNLVKDGWVIFHDYSDEYPEFVNVVNEFVGLKSEIFCVDESLIVRVTE